MPFSLSRIAMPLFLGSVWKRPTISAFISRPRTFPRSTRPLFVAQESQKVIHLHSIQKEELEEILKSWGFPNYRADQVWQWVHTQGVTNVEEMINVPKKLRNQLAEFSSMGSLTLDTELVSKDGTIKRAYRLHDGQLIESVLMPYEDGRYTACISSQAGCAMGCVFCATGQGGFARQLSSGEIYEQVSRFASELAKRNERLSNIVMMGLGEPLANYRNVKEAVNRITKELGIGARRITISTVGVVPNIRKLIYDTDMPQVKLAVSLHCASDEERTALLPANARYGGLTELMSVIKEYIDTTGRRMTFEWALIEGQNDTPQTARRLGQLIRAHSLRRDMVHINVIPLNPTGDFQGSPSGRLRVNEFMEILEKEFGISTTPRVRRGIDIDAGCGQLKTTIEKKEQRDAVDKELHDFLEDSKAPIVGVYEHEDDNGANEDKSQQQVVSSSSNVKQIIEFAVDEAAVDFESDEYEDPEFENDFEKEEAARLIRLVQTSYSSSAPDATISSPGATKTTTTTSIVNDEAIRQAKRRRKKLLKNLKAIGKLKEMQEGGKALSQEQLAKVAREDEWKAELESVQHNLQ
jgi:23S rRNA (adenine2503-C2)-methyltransferase